MPKAEEEANNEGNGSRTADHLTALTPSSQSRQPSQYTSKLDSTLDSTDITAIWTTHITEEKRD